MSLFLGETRSRLDRALRSMAVLYNCFLSTATQSRILGWTATSLLVLAGYIALRSRHIERNPSTIQEAEDPGLFRKHSKYESFTSQSGFTYRRIRVFFHEHPHSSKLPKGLPLLVFVHGLGGNATQFLPLLTSLSNVASCLAIDFPGCGLSTFEPSDFLAYTQTAFAELLAAVIQRYRDAAHNQQVVLVGHSMGCTTSSLLASSSSPLANLISEMVVGFVAICPPATPPSEKEISTIRKLKFMPAFVFDLIRMLDRRGGLESKSITRVVGKAADIETKQLQVKYNSQSKSAVFLRVIRAALQPLNDHTPVPMNGWPGRHVWSGIRNPIFLVAGESDMVTPPDSVDLISRWLTDNKRLPMWSVGTSSKISHELAYSPDDKDKIGSAIPSVAGDAEVAQDQLVSQGTEHANGQVETRLTSDHVAEMHTSSKHSFALKTAVFPNPAAHGLMYAPNTSRVLSGLIEDFFAGHIDERLSLGWQLQHMTISGKWDVKNLQKWQSIDPCSAPIGGIFRAMKTMREVDEVHCPKSFVKHYSAYVRPDGVAMVVDISHETPVYDPKGLEEGGVEYHKFPTVSKLPPTADEVASFISLIDQLRQSTRIASAEAGRQPTIGVHCHYGFNRTGMFIVSYLVERMKYRLQDALDEFAEKRTPGIKHDHFINELYVRYAVAIQRRDTLVE